MPFPSPDTLNPLVLPDGQAVANTVFLKPATTDHPRLEVGDFTYASSHDPVSDWAARLAPYLYPFSPERLVIGRFCAIAHGVQFVTASANHRRDGLSGYPFAIFAGPAEGRPSMPGPGPDTVVGHDVWFGTGAMILPGARIGSGAIIGAGSVVAGAVPAYAVVGGNPARVIRRRLDDAGAARMDRIGWWDWPADMILQHEALICGTDLEALEAVWRESRGK